MLKYFLMKDAMKGVFPSSGPKAPVRTKQDTQSFFLLLFLGDGVVPRVARSVCFITTHPEKGSVWLCFPQQPTLLMVHRGPKESNMETFSGDVRMVSPAFGNKEKGDAEVKIADCKDKCN